MIFVIRIQVLYSEDAFAAVACCESCYRRHVVCATLKSIDQEIKTAKCTLPGEISCIRLASTIAYQHIELHDSIANAKRSLSETNVIGTTKCDWNLEDAVDII
ncbi:hypothetical protein ACFX1X_024216 [Malus domestica]